jgi:hypothetical protein
MSFTVAMSIKLGLRQPNKLNLKGIRARRKMRFLNQVTENTTLVRCKDDCIFVHKTDDSSARKGGEPDCSKDQERSSLSQEGKRFLPVKTEFPTWAIGEESPGRKSLAKAMWGSRMKRRTKTYKKRQFDNFLVTKG